jgi:small-conductance mechanosensitive channel
MPAPMRSATDACGVPSDASWTCQHVYDVTHHVWPARAADFLVDRLPKILVIVVAAWILSRIVRRAIRRLVERLSRTTDGLDPPDRRTQRAATVGALLRSISGATVWTLAALMVIGTFGIALAPVIAGAGIVGAALAFGAQSLVRDFLSGLFMLLEGQFAVGDTIEAGGRTGLVENVTLRTTSLRDDDGVIWHIPNGTITNVGNRSQRWSRAWVDIPLPATVAPAAAVGTLEAAARRLAEDPALAPLLLAPPEVTGPERLSREGYTVRVSVRTRPLRQEPVARALRRGSLEALQAEGLLDAS